LQDAALMEETIMVRGMLSPFGHIAWTAMCGAALWRIKGATKFSFSMLKDRRLWRVFALAVILHMLWNSPISLPFYGKFAILGVAAWIVIFGLIQEGLEELRAEKAAGAAGKKKSEEQSV
jgi:RsiW-degrading membrane proteinase PrsW (M82 family)